MDQKFLEQFEKQFLNLRENTLHELRLRDKSIACEKGDDGDHGREEREMALDLKLLGRHTFMLIKIDNALLKIKNGTFGICEECNGEIEINRLRARPVASQCISCKEEGERVESQVLYQTRSHTLGKTFGTNIVSINPEFNFEDRALVMNY